MNWKPKDGYHEQYGFHHWFCWNGTTQRGSYNSYADALEACRRLNGSL